MQRRKVMSTFTGTGAATTRDAPDMAANTAANAPSIRRLALSFIDRSSLKFKFGYRVPPIRHRGGVLVRGGDYADKRQSWQRLRAVSRQTLSTKRRMIGRDSRGGD